MAPGVQRGGGPQPSQLPLPQRRRQLDRGSSGLSRTDVRSLDLTGGHQQVNGGGRSRGGKTAEDCPNLVCMRLLKGELHKCSCGALRMTK